VERGGVNTDGDTATEADRHIASVFFGDAAGWVMHQVSGGLSGSVVYRCERLGESYALKRWPAGTTARRVDEVHAVIAQARRSLKIVPELRTSSLASTRLSYDGFHYELATWMPGEPLEDSPPQQPPGIVVPGFDADPPSPVEPSPVESSHAESSPDAQPPQQSPRRMLAAVEAGGEAIARFHDAVERFGQQSAPPPAVLRRLGRIEKLKTELPEAIRRRETLSPTLRSAADWLQREGPRRLAAAHETLGQWAGRMVPCQMVLRDVHRGHILFRDAAVSGVVDFDAVGHDTIAADLARWTAGFCDPRLDPGEVLDAAVAGYRRLGHVSACQRDLAEAISNASWVILVANWVVWSALGQRNFSACKDLVDRRVSDLMRRMSTCAAATGA
jgi:Ser/Thr protein kinase RdoA (MazF antagonist)